MNAILRKASSADAAAVLNLVRDCVAAMRAAGIEQWDGVYPNADSFDRDIEAGTLDILCEDNEIIACITVDQNMDPLWQGMDWTPHAEPAMAVHRLMVHPSRQGRGYAKFLMQHAEFVARQQAARSLRLDTFLQNPAAMRLYPGLGYRRTGTAMMRKGEFSGFEKLLLSENMSTHSATIRWENHGPDFLKRRYSREHTWHFDGGAVVQGSPSPSIVPAPWSNPEAIDPEEAFVASVSSCHLLWFLHVAIDAEFLIESYEDAAEGIMTKNERGVPWISRITLRPKITWSGEKIPTEAEVAQLHHAAHEQCFIAASIRTEVRIEPA